METIKIKADRAVAALGILQRLMSHPFEDISDIFSVRRAFVILSKNEEVTAVEMTRQKLVEKYGEKTETEIRVPPGKLYDYMKEYGSISNHIVKIQKFTIPMTVLKSAAKAKILTGADLDVLEPFVKE